MTLKERRPSAATRNPVTPLAQTNMEFATVRSSTPPTPDEYVREHRADARKGLAEPAAPGLRTRAHGSPNGSKQQAAASKAAAMSPSRAAVGGGARRRDRALLDDGRPTQAPHLRRGARRHTDPAAERRRLLTHFQKEGNETARLEHRQWLEREHPEAFVSGETLERVLAELEERTVKVYGGRERQLLHEPRRRAASGASSRAKYGPVEIAFPSAMALSHMWLDKAHPDANARNLRDMWLPAIEWLYRSGEAAWLRMLWTANTASIAPRTPTALH